jgi:methylthioxylose transferase
MEATTVRLGRSGIGPALVPAAGLALAAGTIAYGFAARAEGTRLGASLAPFLWDWRPDLGTSALPAAAVLATGVWLAPQLRAPAVRPWVFAAATLALGLALRLALGSARGGGDGLWAVYEVGNNEAANEYLPALPALGFGTLFFLDTFAEVGTSLPVHAIGHPPGLLLTLHWLGIDGAPGMAALTIGVGALAIPLTYVLARELLDEERARSAALLYVFAPSAVLYGATSADALYATVALAAAIPLALAARPAAARGALPSGAAAGALPSGAAAGALPSGAAALAVASFFSYANLAIGAWATLLAAQRAGLRQAARVAIACAVCLAAFYVLLHLATGYDPVGVLRATESVYREGVASRRPYEFWLFGSPVAFLCALGLPIAWFALRSAGARYAPAVALVAVVIVAAVLGFSKAETERIYQFLVPLACVSAAASLPERWLPLTLGALAVQALAIELLLYTVW